MKHYVHPEAEVIGKELEQLLCNSLAGTDLEDFTDSDQIEW